MADHEAFAISPEIDAAISHALTTWYGYGSVHGHRPDIGAGKQASAARATLCAEILTALATAADTAWHDGYQQCRTDLTALEPERGLRERAERLRRVALSVQTAGFSLATFDELHPGDLANDLTATSSANVRREDQMPPPGPSNIVVRSPNPLPPPEHVRKQ